MLQGLHQRASRCLLWLHSDILNWRLWISGNNLSTLFYWPKSVHFCQQLSQEVLEMWRWVNWTLLWLFCQTWPKEQWLYTRFSLNVLKYLDKLCHEVFPIHLSYINVVKGNQHIFYPVWLRPLSQKEIVKGNFYKRSSYVFQYTNCKRAPNYNDGQTFQFHKMELLFLLHEIDMHISRVRLPATLLKKAKNSSHSGGGQH